MIVARDTLPIIALPAQAKNNGLISYLRDVLQEIEAKTIFAFRKQ